MDKKTLSNLLEGKLFQIPDYQRGYAWEDKQLKDFVQDIDALIDVKIFNHYTGTIVIYQSSEKNSEKYGIDNLEKVDIVDGQQRLTTCSLYLSIILNKLVSLKHADYKAKLSIYLYSGNKTKLTLNNDSADFYLDLITKGVPNIPPNTIHQKKLYNGFQYLEKHINEQLSSRKEKGEEYLKDLFDAITRKLNFSFYPIEVESEIGMTFELMNSRGKDLSSMELLKNYLMYWVYRNVEKHKKEDYTRRINKTWKEVYTNIASSNGSESQCLRIAWTLYVNHTPKNWDGYHGFKSDEVIPLRDFTKKSQENVEKFLEKFIDGLGLISKYYSEIIQPINSDTKEFELLTKINNLGNIANFLPLMVAIKIKKENITIKDEDYLEFLKSLEKFSFRVFLWQGKRSNAGLSKFYSWADNIFSDRYGILKITEWINYTINLYSNENIFRKSLEEDFFDWYQHRRLLKYTLFEYELHLLNGKNKPRINWEDLSDSTLEHIFPQNPDSDSEWLKKWTKDDIKNFTHNIANIVLTKDNSRYRNFEFERKKGMPGIGYSYSNSDIRQERKIAEFDDWTVENCKKRKAELLSWIIENWGIKKHFELNSEELVDIDEDTTFIDKD